MNSILLTQDSSVIIGWVSKLLGMIMQGIFSLIDLIGIPNIGLAIILFTIVVNLLMLPLTVKQQKFSKLSAKMQPEIQAIQKKYKGKTDTDSQMAMNQEVQMVYAKYGVSPSGSCLYLLIQMPILFALYRVIYAIPAYVTKIGETFRVLADKIILVDNADYLLNSEVSTISQVVAQFSKNLNNNLSNGVIDVLNRLSSADLATVAEHYGLNGMTYQGKEILSSANTIGLIDTYNNFLGINIGNSPSHILKTAFASGAWFLVIGALLIPLLSALTQWINVQMMPKPDNSGNEQADAMASTMKSMNMFMPIMSAFFCFTLPAGMGLYWIAGSIVRTIQQIAINRHIDKMDFDEIIKSNSDKSAKKMEKLKQQQEQMNAYANMKTRNINTNTMQKKADISSSSSNSTNTNRTAAPGSMFEKAGMVNRYNEKNNK